MASIPGTLVTREYSNFRGVDFSNKEVNLRRSPNSINMWKNYSKSLGKCIETRPDIELLKSFDNTIYGLFFYKVGNIELYLVHSGTKLYKIVNNEITEIFTGMNVVKSGSFVFNNILYIKDGINYLKFDGEEIQEVIGYVPTTSIGRKPAGGGTTYEDVNMLSDYRINTFLSDGKSTDYYLDTTDISSDYIPIVTVDDITFNPGTGYTVDYVKGIIKFNVAPNKPLTDGRDNVKIRFKKHVAGYAERIKKCTLLAMFDNRVFFSGNQDYPNVVWHCSLNDPSYCSDLDFYNEGQDLAKIKALVPGNNALWVMKEQSPNNTTIFYHNPVLDYEYGKIYPNSHSSISTGCKSTGINFNDDIVFFSDRGMEAITADVTTEQVISHRSSVIDSKLLNEPNYENMLLQEWEGYLLIIIDNKVYLADSREMFVNNEHNEYEFFYWEFDKNISYAEVYKNVLYLCAEGNIYTLTNDKEDRTVNSHWTTPEDEFKYPQYQKTTNKRGCVIDMEGDEITISIKTDNNSYEIINTYQNIKGYIVARIKKKKWKSIQMKYSSTKPFKLFSSTLESYIGGYIKR